MQASYSQPMPKAKIKPKENRQLLDLISIGPAMVRDFKLLGVESVAELARQNPENLYKKLYRITGQRQDPFRLGSAGGRTGAGSERVSVEFS
jgi:pathogenicity locus Cdd1 protein